MELQNINSTIVPENNGLFNDLCSIIDEARRHVATYVNVEACLMNWHVGKRIKEDVLYNQRAEYGKQVLRQLSEKLTERYGAGWKLGSDFTFVDRQKRITVDSEDYFIDLVFFHRGLRRLVAIDLKLGKFKPAYEGQMRLYLRYLNKNDRKPWEEEPIGLILCSEGNTEHIQYFMLDDDSDIRVAQYYTELPSKEVLADRLQRAIAIAREHQIDNK